MNRDELVKLAKAATKNSIPGQSDFRVGAALVGKSGKVYTGCNIEASTSMGICAERVALFKALSEGERDFTTLIICTASGEYCSPCGACRQVLHEYAPELKVVMMNSSGNGLEKKIKELLPLAFDRQKLNNHVVL